MNCDICLQEGRKGDTAAILFNQNRHSDGNGNYHAACEFNQMRRALGMPPFEGIRRVKYYGQGYVPPSRGRVHISLRNEVTQATRK